VQLSHGSEEHTEVQMTFSLRDPVASISTTTGVNTPAGINGRGA
jgi:hypothetical protein